MRWERSEINEITGESIGMCESEQWAPFLAALATLMVIPSALTGIMAYMTKDVDEAYSESWWIFALILVQLEVAFIGVPVVIILRGVSTDGRYLGLIFMMWTFAISPLILIILPKVLAVYKPRDDKKRPRGSREHVKVTGLESRNTRLSSEGVSQDQTSSQLQENII
jgi:hypothetical protein